MISTQEKCQLRSKAHALKPVVMLGNKGLTDSILSEIDLALSHHELIKVKVAGQEREDKAAIIQSIASSTGAEIIQTIGHIAVFYRKKPE
ncbi:MAG: ribosome assembly RNA-binding protein YhbY [Gammaproteobacteria bacterium]|nr:ribosome assembly RNA-binding protein YhbY [Gammaproteobacteria bacterium]